MDSTKPLLPVLTIKLSMAKKSIEAFNERELSPIEIPPMPSIDISSADIEMLSLENSRSSMLAFIVP